MHPRADLPVPRSAASLPALPLAQSLGHAEALLRRARGAGGGWARAASAADLFIDLPAHPGLSGGLTSPAAIETLAALYFAAELEGTHLVSVAELLAVERFSLNLTDRSAAEALEALAQAQRRRWVERTLRNQIFARTFGIGFADTNLGEAAVNHEFEPRFARFCISAGAAAHQLSGWGAPAGAAMRLSVAAQSLLGNLGPRAQGNTLVVAERLTGQLRQALAVLNHPGIAAVFMGRNAWDVLRGVLGPDTPDLPGHVNRAQTGMRLMSWLAGALGPVTSADAQAVIDAVTRAPGLAGWAEIWLDAAGMGGMATQGAGARPAAPGPWR